MNVGRFELRRKLGEGAQANVWLGFDPRLEREVAVKVMRREAAADADRVDAWLREACSASRLTHPNIVPVFEADLYEGQPYLVFEYVRGPTLAEHLKVRGALPAVEACALMIGVLDALRAAHESGVVHRDLKPSNILVDAVGRARVMDFGIAAHLDDPGNLDQIVGTPSYMSPEAANGGLPTVQMDVFSAGVVLVEMLTGRRLVDGRDPFRALRRMATEDLALPDELPAEVDDRLRAILRRSLQRDPAQRWPDASDLRSALQQWLAPPEVPATEPVAAANSGTLDFLLRRMRHRSDFPALSDSVARIQRVARSENGSLASLSSEILKDVALTNKLLRLVNTAHFSGSSSGGSVSTVSRAVSLIGFAGVRNLATSAVLLEHMHDKGHANQLREEFLRALMAGILASELSSASRGGEEAFIGAMFQNLGRLLADYYLPDEARQVRGLIAAALHSGPAPIDEEHASISVLGVGFDALGLGVARAWDLPPALQHCMHKPVGEPPIRSPVGADERLRWLAFTANQITDALLRSDPEQAGIRVTEVAKRYARCLGLGVADIGAATDLARTRLTEMAHAMNLDLRPGSPTRRLFAAPAADTEASGSEPDTIGANTLQATATRVEDVPRSALNNASEVLASGVQEVTNSMVEDFKLNDVLSMILETMYRALGFQRVVFCLRDARCESLTGRFGLGQGATEAAKSFRVPLKVSDDLFSAVCIKGADTLIADATSERIASRLPAWYRQRIDAPSFLLLPMLLRGAPFALIYADKATVGGLQLGEKELSLLRTLRNQAVMAFKQVS